MSNTTDDSKDRIEIHIEDDPQKWGGKMSEIEEIKERWKDSFIGQSFPKIPDPFLDIQILLSFLEKEKKRGDKLQQRVSELDGAIIGWKIVEKVLKEKVTELSDEKLNRHNEVVER